MTVKERLEDISKRCGMSEDIVRRVLDAERDSIIESLKKGNTATLIGRCVITPSMRQKIGLDGETHNYIKTKAKTANSIESELAEMSYYIMEDSERKEDFDFNDIDVVELSSLI